MPSKKNGYSTQLNWNAYLILTWTLKHCAQFLHMILLCNQNYWKVNQTLKLNRNIQCEQTVTLSDGTDKFFFFCVCGEGGKGVCFLNSSVWTALILYMNPAVPRTVSGFILVNGWISKALKSTLCCMTPVNINSTLWRAVGKIQSKQIIDELQSRQINVPLIQGCHAPRKTKFPVFSLCSLPFPCVFSSTKNKIL